MYHSIKCRNVRVWIVALSLSCGVVKLRSGRVEPPVSIIRFPYASCSVLTRKGRAEPGDKNMRTRKKPVPIIGYIDPDWKQKQIAFEDRVYWASRPDEQQSKEVMAKELPPQTYESTPSYVFGLNITKFKSILP